jgi:WD40 repeat protein
MALAELHFSSPHQQTGGLVHFSPDGKLIACAAAYRLVVRDVETLEIVHIFSCKDVVEKIEWSRDSKYVLCGIFKRGLAQVWSVEQPEWYCNVDEGPIGLSCVRFSPGGRHVLATADFQLRITVWSLLDRSVCYIRFPKFTEAGLDFSPDGRQMALAERRDGKDSVALFECEGWSAVRSFPVATEDLADLRWSPDSAVLCVIDTVLQYQVLFYSPDGACLHTYRPYDHALGVKSFCWSPGGRYLALGSFDEKVRLLNHLTWRRIAEVDHPSEVRASDFPGAVCYVEPPDSTSGVLADNGDGNALAVAGTPGGQKRQAAGPTGYVATRPPLTVPTLPPSFESEHAARQGVGLLQWSAAGRYLASRSDLMPCALWIWDASTFGLHAVLLQQQPVTAIAWHPRHELLAVCSGTAKLFLWSPGGCRTAPMPGESNFRVTSMEWSPSGGALLLLDRERFCMCFLAGDDPAANAGGQQGLAGGQVGGVAAGGEQSA